MALIKLYEEGSAGLNIDLPPHELDPRWFTDARNVRFRDGQVETMMGEDDVNGTPSDTPLWLLPYHHPDAYYWFWFGEDVISRVAGTTHLAVTPTSAPTGGANDFWNGGVLHGIPVANNGVDAPIFYNHGTPKWEPLTNWTSTWPDTTIARVLRTYKNFLIALDVTEDGTRNPFQVSWSQPADPGALPSTWDYTSATTLAGRVTLAETGDFLVDCVQLGNYNIIYKTDSTYLQQHVGGIFVFQFDQISSQSGMLAQNCGVLIPPLRAQLVLTGGDVVLQDGQQPVSVVDKRMRNWIFNQLDPNNFERSFVTLNPGEREAWVCFPVNGGDGYCDMAMVFNWVDGSIAIRELNDVSHAVSGVNDLSSSVLWDDQTQTWDSYLGVWDTALFSTAIREMLMSTSPASGTGVILTEGKTLTFNGTSYPKYAERLDLSIVGQSLDGKIKSDPAVVKLIVEVWIRASGDPFQVKLGSRNVIGEAVTWAPLQTFTPGTDQKLDFEVSGALISFKIESNDDVAWKLQGIDFEVKRLGRYHGV